MESGPSNDPSATEDGRSAGQRPDRLERLLEAADVACFRATPEGELIAVNDALTRLTGYTQAELRERSLDALFDGETTLESLGAALDDSSPEPTSTPVSVRTKTDVIPCTVHLDRRSQEPDGDRQPTITGIVRRRDVTAQSAVDAESDLTYGRTFEALADALPDGIIVLDTNSDVQYANPAVERILGYAPDELVGSSKVKIIPERLRQTHLSALQRYLETGERNINWTYVELPGQHRSGHEIPLGVSLNDFIYNGDRYFVGLFRDISPRKEAERTLRSKVAQLESIAYLGRYALEEGDPDDLLEKATELIAVALDIECCVVFERDALGVDDATTTRDATATVGDVFRVRETVGCEQPLLETESNGSAMADSLAGTTLDADDPVVVEDLAADDRFSDASHLLDHDVRSGIGVTIGSLGDPWGVLTVYDDGPREFGDHDVDFLESAATIIATTLERQRYERQLSETVDELEASNERLEQFAYAASHDLQEPLRMVSSYLGLIESRYADDLDDDGEEFIAYAVDGAERMRAMIDGLLEYSRIDTQGDPLEPVDLDAVLEDVLTDLQMMIEETDAEIAADSLPTVRGDPRQLRQLFQNLLSNAIEYAGDEPPQVHISACEARSGRESFCDSRSPSEVQRTSEDASTRSSGAAESEGQMWKISVSDNGIGIDPDEQERVFRVFQRLHSREEHDGTGIGLALCRRIVERHGGEIRVESEPGEGSTFSVTLPRATSTPDASEQGR